MIRIKFDVLIIGLLLCSISQVALSKEASTYELGEVIVTGTHLEEIQDVISCWYKQSFFNQTTCPFVMFIPEKAAYFRRM